MIHIKFVFAWVLEFKTLAILLPIGKGMCIISFLFPLFHLKEYIAGVSSVT